MTLEQLEERVNQLGQQIVYLQREIRRLRPLPADTFGMFADDPEFDEIVRLGREYRRHVNIQDE